MYDKIKALISRNDFATAEKLLEKHSSDLNEQQKNGLRDLIAEQRSKKQKDALKRDRRLRRRGRWRVVWAIEKGVFISWIILGFIVGPYAKMEYFSSLARRNHQVSYFQPRLGMELLRLLFFSLPALFFALELFDAHQRKVEHQDKKLRAERAERPDHDTIRTFELLENIDAKKEKQWLIALLCTILWVLFRCWLVFDRFIC